MLERRKFKPVEENTSPSNGAQTMGFLKERIREKIIYPNVNLPPDRPTKASAAA